MTKDYEEDLVRKAIDAKLGRNRREGRKEGEGDVGGTDNDNTELSILPDDNIPSDVENMCWEGKLVVDKNTGETLGKVSSGPAPIVTDTSKDNVKMDSKQGKNKRAPPNHNRSLKGTYLFIVDKDRPIKYDEQNFQLKTKYYRKYHIFNAPYNENSELAENVWNLIFADVACVCFSDVAQICLQLYIIYSIGDEADEISQLALIFRYIFCSMGSNGIPFAFFMFIILLQHTHANIQVDSIRGGVHQ